MILKKVFYFCCICFLSILSLSFEKESKKPLLMVSISPQKFLVKQIAGDSVSVTALIPKNSDPHIYEPSTRQALELARSDVWLQIGEPFEKKIKTRPLITISALEDLKNFLLPIGHQHKGCKHPNFDTHTWLSLKLLRKQAEQITNVLIKLLPQNEELYLNNLKKFQEEASILDEEIKQILYPLKNPRVIAVGHNAYEYFCQDYNIQMLSLEMNSSESSLKDFSRFIKKIKKQHINTIFLQKQNVKNGSFIANKLNLNIVWLNPYEENIFENLKTIAKAFANS